MLKGHSSWSVQRSSLCLLSSYSFRVRRLKNFKQIYEYQGEATCAADGMCQEKCPVKINTGELIKSIRAEQMKDMKQASGGAMVRVAPPFIFVRVMAPVILSGLAGD